MAADEDWGVQLQPVDWSSRSRASFRRRFLDLPDQEDPEADRVRKTLGVQIEDRGGQWILPRPAQTFEELPMLPAFALDSLREHAITTPMPVQAQSLPLVLAGFNVIGLAQTGSGKTLAFLLPATAHIEDQRPLQKGDRNPIALVLAPTRELAVQIGDEATKVLKHSKQGRHKYGVWAVCLYGGGKKSDQLRSLDWGCHMVVATPGRLLDMLGNGSVSLDRVTYLVLDEADRMLDFGFQGDVDMISSQIRPERQVLFFSATWSTDVQRLASGLCDPESRPVRFSAGPGEGKGHSAASDGDARRQGREGIVQEVIVVDHPGDHEKQHAEKQRLLEEHLHSVLNASEDNKVLVFVSMKSFADELANKLWEAGFATGAMHGGKAQEARLWSLEQFRQGKLRLLVATDVIGRGIDIPSVSHVVIFDMGSVDDYVHRIGRTARGKNGKGHALVFFEYWHKDPGIAADLAEVLEASRQAVPPGLRRIIGEVQRGEREVFDPNAQWNGRGKWKADSWSQHAGGTDKSFEQDRRPNGSTAGSWANGPANPGYSRASAKAPMKAPAKAVVPDSWDGDEEAASPEAGASDAPNAKAELGGVRTGADKNGWDRNGATALQKDTGTNGWDRAGAGTSLNSNRDEGKAAEANGDDRRAGLESLDKPRRGGSGGRWRNSDGRGRGAVGQARTAQQGDDDGSGGQRGRGRGSWRGSSRGGQGTAADTKASASERVVEKRGST